MLLQLVLQLVWGFYGLLSGEGRGGKMRGEIWTTEWAEGRAARAVTERERDGMGKSDAVAENENRNSLLSCYSCCRALTSS